MNSLNEWERACKYFIEKDSTKFYKETIDCFKKDKCQYFCLKFYYLGQEYSIDFIPNTTIKKIINAYKKLDQSYSEVYKITNLPQNNSYCFKWGGVSFKERKKNTKLDNSYIINCPLYIKKEKLFYGILLNKLLTGYKTVWDSNVNDKYLQRLVTVSMRKIFKANNDSNITTLIKSLTRYPRFTKEYQDTLHQTLTKQNEHKN